MAMHLFTASLPSPQPSNSSRRNPGLRILCAYEDGSVKLWSFTRTDKQTSVEGIGWEALWSVKLHVESGALSSYSLSIDFEITDCSGFSYGYGCF